MDSLRKCLKLDALRKALNTLPKTLNDTYERILSSLDEEYEEYALKIFQWLCFSIRPMRIKEMVEVLAIDSTNEFCFKPEQRLPDPRDILTICSTLVNVTAAATSTQTSETEELRLAHFSVKEYLISESLKKSSMHRYHTTQLSGHVSIAKTCLSYLLHFESPAVLVDEFDREFPLIKYAAEFWPWHYRSITNDADREALDFLGYQLVESEKSCFINWLTVFNPDSHYIMADLDLKANEVSSPLYYMSYLGVSGVLKMLLSKGAIFNPEDGLDVNALRAALSNGHEAVVRLLLEDRTNVNAEEEWKDTPLIIDSLTRNEGLVQLLLEEGVEVNDVGRTGSALSHASLSGHEGAVRLLLEKWARVNAKCGIHGNALSAASWNGYEEVMWLLLENGAEVNAVGGEYGNALSAASWNGHERVVQLLLERGAEVNAVDGTYGNALSAALWRGHEEVVQLLVKKGAEINALGGEYGNALSAASWSGHEGVVQ